MKKSALFSLLFFFLIASKCKETPIEPGFIDITFKPVFNEQPFVMNKIYNIGGKNVKFSRLAFYVSKITLTGATGAVVGENTLFYELDGLDDSLKAAKGVSQRLSNLPLAAYNRIGFGLGVDSVQNALDPSKFKSNSPLSNPDYYWSAWNSYIFAKLEGVIDKDGDGRYETGITLHTGGNSCFKTTEFDHIFDVNATGYNVPIILNINTLLNNIDLATVNSTHSTGDLPTMEKMMANFAAACRLGL